MKIKILDITRDSCPLTFVKTKLEFEKLNDGEILEILLTTGEPLENVPRALKELNCKILEIKNIDGRIFKITVQK